MSFCRPLLLPVHAPKVPQKYLATSSIHALYNASGRINTGRRTFGSSLRFLGRLHTRENTLYTTSPSVAHSSTHISERAQSTTNKPVEHVAGKLTTVEYEKKRAQDPEFIAKLPVSIYMDVFSSAVRSQQLELAESVISDIFELYAGSDRARCDVLATILRGKELPPLRRETILRILHYLKQMSLPRFALLIAHDDATIVRKMIHTSRIRDTDRAFLRLFYPALLERLETMRKPRISRDGLAHPPFLIYASFSVIQKLLSMSFTEYALNIFQALLEIGYVPSEALYSTGTSASNASLIISVGVIRSCLHWRFGALAAAIMTEIITSNPTDKVIIDLNIEVIHHLLSTQYPTQKEVLISGHLIRRIHHHSPVPDSVIRLFYDKAVAADAKEEAEELYAFTRQEPLRATHQYPPPHDSALPWLMDHLAMTSSRTHLSRTLAKEAVEDELWIPTLYRAQFIARTAALGYATQARALWERYVVGKDGAVVAGNSALMIRMVSLFWNMHRTNREKVTALEAQEERPETREKIEKYKRASEDAAVLAERVRGAFNLHHAPLKDAPHWDLTSFARACFIVGKISEGYKAFSHLLSRQESPDLYDCNVALSAVAQINPRLAEKMIAQMTTIGLQPDGISFSTAFHYAVMQGEKEVVDAMIERIHGLNDVRMLTKTLASLVRASVTVGAKGPKRTKEELQHLLSNILRLVKSFPEQTLGPQTQMGKMLVYAAIHIKDGVMAYELWKLLLKKGAQWDDREQKYIRHEIGRLIRQRSFALPRQRKTMLSQLGQRKTRL